MECHRKPSPKLLPHVLDLALSPADGLLISACKRKDVMEVGEQHSAPKKPRLVFTDLQRRTLQAIFKVSCSPTCLLPVDQNGPERSILFHSLPPLLTMYSPMALFRRLSFHTGFYLSFLRAPFPLLSTHH